MADGDVNIQSILASGRQTHRGRRALIALALLGLAGWGGYTWVYAPGQQSTADVYQTVAATVGDLSVTVTAVGTVEPTEMVEISSELSGTIASVEVDFNDQVTAGQVLARLDTTALEASVAHSHATLAAREAQVAQVQATQEEMQAQFDRAQSLLDRGVSTLEVFNAAQFALRRAQAALLSAQADVEVARADMDLNEANLAKACVCSPIDGIVLDRNVDPGQIVAASLSAPVLFTLAEDLSRMDLRVDVDEADIGKVSAGDDATFTVEAFQDRSFAATVTELRNFPATINGVVTYQVVLSLDNSGQLLRPGMTAVADITVERIAGALLVPNAALRFSPPEAEESGGGSGLLGMLFRRTPSAAPAAVAGAAPDGTRPLWLLRDGQAVQVAVRVGASDGLMTVITEGDLAEGDLVITDLAVAE